MPQNVSNRFAIVATDWRRISSASDSRLMIRSTASMAPLRRPAGPTVGTAAATRPSSRSTAARYSSPTVTGRRVATSISTTTCSALQSSPPWSSHAVNWNTTLDVPIRSTRTNTSSRSSNRAGAWYSTRFARITNSRPAGDVCSRPRWRRYSTRARSKYGM